MPLDSGNCGRSTFPCEIDGKGRFLSARLPDRFNGIRLGSCRFGRDLPARRNGHDVDGVYLVPFKSNSFLPWYAGVSVTAYEKGDIRVDAPKCRLV